MSSPVCAGASGDLIVVKYGGHAMTDANNRDAFVRDLAAVLRSGTNVVLVHGGGPQIDATLTALGISSTFERGLRVTTAEVMDVVQQVLLGSVQPDLLTRLGDAGVAAIGLSGANARLLQSDLLDPDLGLVGGTPVVDVDALHEVLQAGFLPVVSSLAANRDFTGEAADRPLLNVNADMVAGAIAAAMGARALVVMTNVAGIYANWPDQDSLLTDVTLADLNALLPSLQDGMIPKLAGCLHALQSGVPEAYVVDGRPVGALGRCLAGQGDGTRIRGADAELVAPGDSERPMPAVEWSTHWSAVMMHNYATPPIRLVRGHGARVWDGDGNEYLDMLAGIAVNALGHGHPGLRRAVHQQMRQLGHVSNLAASDPAMGLADRILALMGPAAATGGRVFFCNSGAEANEAAFKIARLTKRPKVVVAQGSFHGRTIGALSWTAQPAKQEPFLPLPGEVQVVPFGDSAALAEAIDERTAAVVLEPIQGEGGIIVPPLGYLKTAQELAHAHGALFMLDEVQTGIARTGDWFAFQHEDLRPDVITLAKGLGGGLPIGACVAVGEAATLLTPGTHGSTFGGNPICAAAALAVLQIIDQDGLLERVRRVGEELAVALVPPEQSVVTGVRGRGLLLAAVLRDVPAAQVEQHARVNGLIVNAVAEDAIRVAPPLILSDQDVREFAQRWGNALTSLRPASTIGSR
ncbi:MAG: acetylornithine transaminase [Actinomycetales bacterium]